MTLPLPHANPLLEAWTGPFEAPPFDRIAPQHFEPAFEAALKQGRAEIGAIAADPAPPTFANTIEAMERSGRTLDRVAKVFFNLAGAETNDELEAIERAIAPVLSRHASDTYLNDGLFRRIDALKANQPSLGLTPEQARALARTHLDFTRAGAGLAPEAKSRLAAIGERLAALSAAFGQNVLADERAWAMWLDQGDLDGLPDFWVASAARLAAERGHPGRYAVTLSRSSIEPFLQFSARRDLRETAFRAWGSRGENGGATDNRAIAAEMVHLRAERAKLLGYQSHEHHPAHAEPDVGDLHRRGHAVQHDDLMAPVELAGRARRERQRDEGARRRARMLLPPTYRITANGGVAAVKAEPLQFFEYADQRQTLARRLLRIGVQQSLEPFQQRAKPRHRLPGSLVTKLRRARANDFPHHLARNPQLAADLLDRLAL